MADSGFVIDDVNYDVPTLDSFDMNEAQILYDTSGLALEDFAVDDGDPDAVAELQKNIRNPGFIRALMTVAYIRGTGASRKKAEAVIGQANLIGAIKSFAESVEVDADPPTTPSAQHDPFVGAESRNDPSGQSSSNGSGAEPAELPVATGTSESDTSRDRGRELLERGSRLT